MTTDLNQQQLEQSRQAESDFASGFTSNDPTPIPAPDAEKKTEAEQKPDATTTDTPAATPEADKVDSQAAPAAEPKYVQLTQEQFDALQAAANKTASHGKGLDKLGGTLGELQQVVKRLQEATPAGAAIEIPADAFAEMAVDYPDLAEMNRKALEKVLKGLRGTAPKPETAAPPAAAQPDTAKIVLDVLRAREMAELDEDHEGWRETIGAVDNDGKPIDPENPFRKWLATQDAKYQHKVNNTNSAKVIGEAIDRFEASKTAPATPKKNGRQDDERAERIKEAVQPKGDGRPPRTAKTAADEFREGFEGD